MTEPVTDASNQYLNWCFKIIEGHYGPFQQILGIAFLVIIFNFIIKVFLLKLRQRFKDQNNEWAWSFVAALPKPLSFFVWFTAIICTIDTISSGFFDFHLINLHMFIKVGLVFSFGWFLIRLNKKVCYAIMMMNKDGRAHLTAGKIDLLSKLATIASLFVTTLLLMEVTDRSMQTLIAFGGIGGLALAFASQQMISNFFGGLMVYITQPFTIGEWVILPEKNIEGHIEEIGWYLTCIRSMEKRPIYIPNSIFTQTVVINPSRMTHERVNYKISLRYRDVQAIKPIIDQIKLFLLNHPEVDHNLKTEVYFVGFGASTVDVNISTYLSKTGSLDFSGFKQELFFKITTIVKEFGAELNTPTNIVEIDNPVKLKPEQEEKLKN